jgi:hypothetical protein
MPFGYRRAVSEHVSVYDVFTPSAFPRHTYVAREERHLEAGLHRTLQTPGQVASLSGPSKCGKTVLVQRTVGEDYLIKVSGASILSPQDLWDKALDWMGTPHVVTASDADTDGTGGVLAGKTSAGIGIVKFEASGTSTTTRTSQRTTTATAQRGGLAQVAREIAGSDWVVFIDDFHYMSRELQQAVAKSLKEAAEQRIRICTASVPHRADDVVRALPELRGRVTAIDMTYWQPNELEEIARLGFKTLRAELKPAAVGRLAQEAAGSPQLMQNLCLNVALDTGLESSPPEKVVDCDISPQYMGSLLRRTAASTDFRSLVDVLRAGPKTRGRDRTEYRFKGEEGGTGDVYDVVVKAIAADPPSLTFPYDDLTARVRRLCDDKAPSGGSVVTSCRHMSALAKSRMPNERALDWDEGKQVMDISDPLLLFYLRWGP